MTKSRAELEVERLYRMGFRGAPILDEAGDHVAVFFVREFKRVREVVLIYAEDDAYAYRTRFAEVASAHGNPLYFDPDELEYVIARADVVSVVRELLSLPAAIDPLSPPAQARPWTPRPGP